MNLKWSPSTANHVVIDDEMGLDMVPLIPDGQRFRRPYMGPTAGLRPWRPRPSEIEGLIEVEAGTTKGKRPVNVMLEWLGLS